MESEFSSMDRLFFPSWVPSCAPDGNFGKVQRDREDYAVKYCSDREGEQIEDFRVRRRGVFCVNGSGGVAPCQTRRRLAFSDI